MFKKIVFILLTLVILLSGCESATTKQDKLEAEQLNDLKAFAINNISEDAPCLAFGDMQLSSDYQQYTPYTIQSQDRYEGKVIALSVQELDVVRIAGKTYIIYDGASVRYELECTSEMVDLLINDPNSINKYYFIKAQINSVGERGYNSSVSGDEDSGYDIDLYISRDFLVKGICLLIEEAPK